MPHWKTSGHGLIHLYFLVQRTLINLTWGSDLAFVNSIRRLYQGCRHAAGGSSSQAVIGIASALESGCLWTCGTTTAPNLYTALWTGARTTLILWNDILWGNHCQEVALREYLLVSRSASSHIRILWFRSHLNCLLWSREFLSEYK